MRNGIVDGANTDHYDTIDVCEICMGERSNPIDVICTFCFGTGLQTPFSKAMYKNHGCMCKLNAEGTCFICSCKCHRYSCMKEITFCRR